MNKNHQKPIKGIAIILRDVMIFGLALVVFALFHHVLPKAGGSKLSIVDVGAQGTKTKQTPAVNTPALNENAADAPAPTNAPAAPGDFSAVFPSEDTGTGALYSYQSDTLRIAINQVQSNGITYYVADVWVKNIDAFKTAFAKGQYGQGIHERPVAMAENNYAVLAMTGDYYGARAKGIVIRNGELYRDTLYGDVAVLFADGTLETYSIQEFSIDAAIERKAYQAWSFGPKLLENGQPIEVFTDAIKEANPRSAIGYYEPGHYCLVVVDGRQPGYSKGITLVDLSKMFYNLGCKAAYNLDGGQTAMMVFQGVPVNQAYKGGRECSDILYFGVK
ncbi:MAG TPA: phosphodiester glycosidase family protein [Clostridia bacterium]|nr:phosphodiester glycosidase family protein [Clostridia bacterium]